MNEMREILTTEEVVNKLKRGQVIEDVLVLGDINLLDQSVSFKKDVIFRNCSLGQFISPSTEFYGNVVFESCEIKKFVFNYTYFFSGLRLIDCTVSEYLDFEAGGHNKNGEFILRSNTFEKFVNFFDCWFLEPVIVENNLFKDGTNLLGNVGLSFSVKFEKGKNVSGNQGRLDIDGQGDKQINIVDLT